MDRQKHKKQLTKQEALAKLEHYCVYQDRCHNEVRTKLLALQVYGDELEEIIGDLIQENFLNEERFARSYARGKFRINKWGRNKIKIRLKAKYVSDYCIKKGLSEIDEEEYFEVLEVLIIKHWERRDQTKSDFISKQKVIKFCMSRGFEYELIKNILQAQG